MFKNLTIRLRLVFVIGFLSVLLVLGGVIGLVSLAGANDTLRNNYEQRMLPMSRLDQIVRVAGGVAVFKLDTPRSAAVLPFERPARKARAGQRALPAARQRPARSV